MEVGGTLQWSQPELLLYDRVHSKVCLVPAAARVLLLLLLSCLPALLCSWCWPCRVLLPLLLPLLLPALCVPADDRVHSQGHGYPDIITDSSSGKELHYITEVRAHSSAEERCGPHVAISPTMLRSSNELHYITETFKSSPGSEAKTHPISPLLVSLLYTQSTVKV